MERWKQSFWYGKMETKLLVWKDGNKERRVSRRLMQLGRRVELKIGNISRASIIQRIKHSDRTLK